MAKEFFIIFDKGENWEITDTMIIPDGYEMKHEGVLDVSDNKELFEAVREKLKTHRILYQKDIEGKLIEEDLMLIAYDLLEISRQRKITQGKEYLNTRIGLTDMFGFVEFVILNNILMEKGYVITDTNRHEKYLEIVETGDMELIEKLEDFLEIRDSIAFKYSWYNIYKEYVKKINKAESIKELQDIWVDYIQTFE